MLHFCSCLYFQFLLPHFKFPPHLQHALAAAAAAALTLTVISQEISVNPSGLFPGSLSPWQSALAMVWYDAG